MRLGRLGREFKTTARAELGLLRNGTGTLGAGAFAWFGLGSNLSFGLADYFLVNRPTEPFHIFLLYFLLFSLSPLTLSLMLSLHFPLCFCFFCFLCFCRLARRNRDIAR